MKSKFIIFDMDNTLIDTDPLYIDARTKLVSMMSVLGCDPDLVYKRQDQIDASLFNKFGYSTERFAESFDLTVREFLSPTLWSEESINRYVSNARSFAMDVFNQKAIEYPYSNKVVRNFLYAGYKIAVITAGERWVQIKRFDDLSMRNLFHDCWVVIKKTSDVFLDFCAKHNVDKNKSWMIGDSIRSDILPAIEVGLNAVHLKTSNWKSVEVDASKLPAWINSVENLSMVPEIILES